jgi:hypothetical protein
MKIPAISAVSYEDTASNWANAKHGVCAVVHTYLAGPVQYEDVRFVDVTQLQRSAFN